MKLIKWIEYWPKTCDLCHARGVDFLGVWWLCARCRARELQALEREIDPHVQHDIR